MPFFDVGRRLVAQDLVARIEKISLHSILPDENGSDELAGNGYERIDFSDFAIAANGQITNASGAAFPSPSGADWLRPGYFGFWTAADEFIRYEPLGMVVDVPMVGANVLFDVGAIIINIV